MNTPVRRVSIAVMVMILMLLANLTYIQVVKADEYRSDSRNKRVLFAEYEQPRGQISAGGQVLASSVENPGGRLRYQRVYADGPLYAPVTGYYSETYGSTGIERTERDVLNGSDDSLFVRRLSDLITGRDPRGGSVVLTIDPAVQKAAYDALTQKGYVGAVVAIRPQTGEILAMVSTPSFDPNPLASPDLTEQEEAKLGYDAEATPVLVNRAITRYPPGSTFKVVVTAAALKGGLKPNDPVTTAPEITLVGTNADLENFGGKRCGDGPGPTISLREAFARSCNTAFAEIVVDIGEDPLRAQAEAFGIGVDDLAVPIPGVDPSTLGEIVDTAALQQSAIGQKDVELTPLQNAMIVAAIANGGELMRPYLVREILGPELESIEVTDPEGVGQAVDAGVARTLTELMIGAEERTPGEKIRGVQIAAKTGTAEHGADPKNTPPHNWYVAFAPAEDPQIAVAVLVENGGDDSLEATGGKVAAPIGRAVIAAGLSGAR